MNLDSRTPGDVIAYNDGQSYLLSNTNETKDLYENAEAKKAPGPRDTRPSSDKPLPFDAGSASAPELQLIADRSDAANRVLRTLPTVVVTPPAKQPVGETEQVSVIGAFFGRPAFEVADLVADEIPYLGQAKGVAELATGQNALGEDLGAIGKFGAAFNIIPGGGIAKRILNGVSATATGTKRILGALVGAGKKADDVADGAGRMGKAVTKMAKAVDDVPKVTPFRDNSLSHIFQPKHNLIDTIANRQLIQSIAGDAANFVGKNEHGTRIFSKIQADGSQIWVYVYNGQIFDAGRNLIPRILP